MLNVAVEGRTDQTIVKSMLAAADITNVSIVVAKGNLGPSQLGLKRLNQLVVRKPCIVVYDQDSGSVGDAVEKNIHHSEVLFCPAIPTVEAWLFADSDALFTVLGDRAEALVGRMPLPEQLPYPKFLKSTILRDKDVYRRLLERINIRVAGSRSPSLKYFIETARRLSAFPPIKFDQSSNPAGQISREILRNLISEVYPSNKALFRSASGVVVTAEQMMQEITNGTDLGREYSSDILRVARDLLSRQAQKKSGESDGRP